MNNETAIWKKPPYVIFFIGFKRNQSVSSLCTSRFERSKQTEGQKTTNSDHCIHLRRKERSWEKVGWVAATTNQFHIQYASKNLNLCWSWSTDHFGSACLLRSGDSRWAPWGHTGQLRARGRQRLINCTSLLR